MTDHPQSSGSKFTTRELDIERRILRARSAAVDSLEQGNWDAVVLSCGKVLQEVARNELPYNEHSGTLPQLLERLARRLQTDQPVSDLAAALKDADGLRGFFDLEADVDEELARATLSVVESFLTYTYAFREEVRRLNELVGSRRAGAPSESKESAPMPEPHVSVPQPEDRPRAAGTDRKPDRPETGEKDQEAPPAERGSTDRAAAESRSQRQENSHSVFDRFDDRNEDPIRQTWRPPRSED